MAISTAKTYLNYASTCPLQVESVSVAITTVTAGNLSVTVTASDIAGTAVTTGVATFTVPLIAGWTAIQVANAIKTKFNDTTLSNLSLLYTVEGTSPAIVLTRKVATNNDATLAIVIPTALGVTGATSTHTTAGGTFAKLCDINSYPDFGQAPSKLDTTTLSDYRYKTNIFGLEEPSEFTFESNYDDTEYNTINGLNGNYFFQVVFDEDGKFDWQGQVDIFANAGAVDEIRKMTIVISALKQVQFNIIN